MNFFTTCLHSGLLCCCCPLRTKEDGSSLEVALQKLAKALRARIAEHLLRRPLFLDTTLVEKHRLARDLAGEAHLVGHHRSEEVRVGKEWGSTCRSRGWRYH